MPSAFHNVGRLPWDDRRKANTATPRPSLLTLSGHLSLPHRALFLIEKAEQVSGRLRRAKVEADAPPTIAKKKKHRVQGKL